jgi:hypothetical protein
VPDEQRGRKGKNVLHQFNRLMQVPSDATAGTREKRKPSLRQCVMIECGPRSRLQRNEVAKKETYLRRYTDLSALFYLLAERKLTLLDPRRWDDKNDYYCLKQYRVKYKLESVLALCFVQAPERYHFWRIFGAGSSGVRIKFKKQALLKSADKVVGMRHGKVK